MYLRKEMTLFKKYDDCEFLLLFSIVIFCCIFCCDFSIVIFNCEFLQSYRSVSMSLLFGWSHACNRLPHTVAVLGIWCQLQQLYNQSVMQTISRLLPQFPYDVFPKYPVNVFFSFDSAVKLNPRLDGVTQSAVELANYYASTASTTLIPL